MRRNCVWREFPHLIPAMNTNSRSQRTLGATALLCIVLTAFAQAQDPVRYTVVAKDAGDRNEIRLEVAVRVERPSGTSTPFWMPVWTPGSYRHRDFPERVTVLGARAGDAEVPVQQVDRGKWLVEHGAVPAVELRYALRLLPGDRFMDPSHDRRAITYEGPAVYMTVPTRVQSPCTVRFEMPQGWQVASGLRAGDDGLFHAPDYDVLADCPTKLGVFQRFEFTSLGKPVAAVLDCAEDLTFDHAQWLAGLAAITDEAGSIFGGHPFDNYVFLFTLSRTGGGGGLEHLNSTAIGHSRALFQRNPSTTFGISAHEFVHTWNVKRLRPVELGPFAYDRANRTTGLWLAEGVTSWYGDVLMARAGHTPVEQFWKEQAAAIAGWENTPGRAHTSPMRASWMVWDRQAPDRKVDYYGAGQVLGLLLELQVRHASGNQRSLDDAMDAMFRACGKLGRGLTEQEIATHLSDAAGTDLRGFVAKHADGTLVPDYATILGYAGIEYAATPTQRPPYLRGIDTSRKEQLAFTDFESLDRMALTDVISLSGTVKTLDGQAVAGVDAVDQAVRAAIADGRTSIEVGYETANGRSLKARARVEQAVRVRVELQLREDATAAQKAIRDAITKPRRKQD